MERLRIPLLFGLALLASAAAQAASLPASPERAAGVYSVTFNLRLASKLPSGTTITCRAQIVPSQGGLNPQNPRMAAFPVGTATGLAAVTGSTATCAAEIPFSWTVASARNGLVLRYEIDAVSSAGATPLLSGSSAPQAGSASLSLAF